jgi:ribosome-binding protein aMBF1 (putative translation factor)
MPKQQMIKIKFKEFRYKLEEEEGTSKKELANLLRIRTNTIGNYDNKKQMPERKFKYLASIYPQTIKQFTESV